MSRMLIVVATLLVFAGLGWLVVNRGMEQRQTDPKQNQASAPSAEDFAQADSSRLGPPKFESWPKPAAVLVLTGEQHGYLEPCGCSEKQSGGIARRSDLMHQLENRGWPTAGLDLGGTIKRNRKQSEIKFIAMKQALDRLNYQAMGLGPEELGLQPAFLLSQNLPTGDQPSAVPFLGTNITFFGVPDLDGGPKQVKIFELGGVKIGAAMVLGEEEQRDAYPEGSGTDVTFTPPAEVLPAALQAMEQAGVQVRVLLSYASTEESKALATGFPQFDIVVSAGGPEDPQGKPTMVGGTMLLHVGHKGKYAGVLAIYPNQEEKLRFDLVDLNRDRFKHDRAMDAIMAEYQQMLKDNLTEVFADLPKGFPPKPGSYIGAAKCGQCHTKAYAKWKETKHAHAYQSLSLGRKDFDGDWVNRMHDPECLSCHVTGWNPQEVYPYDSGFLPKELAEQQGALDRFALLQGQQCENCHGPGSRHAEVLTAWMKDPKSVPSDQLAAANRAVKVDLSAAEQSCVRCHDHENSPHFDFKTYWEKVRHPGRD